MEGRKLRQSIRDALLQFYRNGRWGDCVDCPRDADGKAYPEFCNHTKRYDHNLSIQGLTNQILLDEREIKKARENEQAMRSV